MVVVKFNKSFRDKELKRDVKANEPVEMTLKRADEVVKNIRKQSNQYSGYEEFAYERVEEDPPAGEPEGTSPADEKKEKQGKGE